MASATPSAFRLPLPYGSVMDLDMSMRKRNALGLLRLISASYDMLPPFSRPAGPHLPAAWAGPLIHSLRSEFLEGERGRRRGVRCVAHAPAAEAPSVDD